MSTNWDVLLSALATGGKKLVVTAELQPAGGVVPPPVVVPPDTGGGGTTPPTPPPPVVGYDTTTNNLLLSGFSGRLDAQGVPDFVMLAPLYIPLVYVPEGGMEKGNSCLLWEGALMAPEDGEYTFNFQVKSGGYIKFDNDLKWEQDREKDPGSQDSVGVTFKVTLKKDSWHALKAECVEQAGMHMFFSNWTRPSGRQESIPSQLCAPPADWQKRLKVFIPPPPPPSTIPTQPDWTTYQSPALPPGTKLFPATYDWYTDISAAPVDPASAAIIAGIGNATLHPEFGQGMNGLPINVLDATAKPFPVTFDVPGESDPGPYLIPPAPALEGGGDPAGDYHYLGVDLANQKLYEIYQLRRDASGKWSGYAGVVWDMTKIPNRPAGWTSADASGGPMTQGLVRPEEVLRDQVVNHALRVTVPVSRWRHAYVAPANHLLTGGVAPDLIPMGARFRLKASVDLSGLAPAALVIAKAMQVYGLFAVDGTNSSQMFFTGVPDSRWDDSVLAQLKRFTSADLEVVQLGTVVTG